MKQLEDRIKDRLEGYESSLPDGDLAEFKALLEASAIGTSKRNAAYLAWLAPVAVASGLALFFILGHSPQQDVIQIADSNSLVADVVETLPSDTNNLAEPEPVEDATSVYANTAGEKRAKRPDTAATVKEEPENKETASDISEHSASDQAGNDLQLDGAEQKVEDKRKDDGSSMNSNSGYAPFVPSDNNIKKPVSVKVGKATAGVIGGTGALALTSVLPSFLMGKDASVYCEPVDPGEVITDPERPVDGRTWKDTHHMPLQAGLSLRLPLSEKWSLTTGITYSWYSSKIEYSLSGNHNQNVHYFGIPLRADYTIAKNKWMDVYVGAGSSVNFCVAAYDAGRKTTRDGVGFALIGAGGVQFNISNNLGLFLDPTFSWNIPSEDKVLDTYRSEHPFLFSISTGLRITLHTENY